MTPQEYRKRREAILHSCAVARYNKRDRNVIWTTDPLFYRQRELLELRVEYYGAMLSERAQSGEG
jgi:hypothetical protein